MPEGTVLKGRYEVGSRLGSGGSSTVFRARDRETGDVVAVKQLKLTLKPGERASAYYQLEEESTILRGLDHPHLVAVRDHFVVEDTPFTVLDFIEGTTLAEALAAAGAPFHEVEVIPWALQLCDVLRFLHGQHPPIVVRDVKPGNIMLSREGHVCLIDLGLARVMLEGESTTSWIKGDGSPGYAPVEQFTGGTDHRTDIYSLGATLYTLLSGHVPPLSLQLAVDAKHLDSLRQHNPGLSSEMEALVLHMMAIKRTDRPQSIAEVEHALRALPLAVETTHT